MVCGCMCAQYWMDKSYVAMLFKKVWSVMQIALFMLIGAEIDLSVISGDEVGVIVAMLAISLTVRLVVTFCVSMGSGLTVKERLFVAVAWFPKATVQAAVGSTVLDRAMSEAEMNDYFVEVGQFILTAAVLSIVISAPIGAVGIFMTGPRWLKQTKKECEDADDEEKEMNGDEDIVDLKHTTEAEMECAA